MIGAGHTLEAIRGYSIGQFYGFVAAVGRLEAEKMAALLNVITVGTSGDEKAVEKMQKLLHQPTT